jgi:hypothetical protein
METELGESLAPARNGMRPQGQGFMPSGFRQFTQSLLREARLKSPLRWGLCDVLESTTGRVAGLAC